jgi:hypothetical protein
LQRRGPNLRFYFTINSSVPATVDLRYLTATDNTGRQYVFDPGSAHYYVPAGNPVSDWNVLVDVNPARTMTFAFSTIKGANPAFANGLEVLNVPLPS